MDDYRLDRLEQKIDDLNHHLSSIDTTLALQHASLAEHIHRSDLLEKKLEPVEKHVSMIHGVLKFIGLLGILAGIASTILKFLKVF